MNQPIYGLHSDSAGKVLAAADFTHSYQLTDWLRKLDIRAGDKIEFQEVSTRADFDEVGPDPAFIETPPTPPASADDGMTF